MTDENQQQQQQQQQQQPRQVIPVHNSGVVVDDVNDVARVGVGSSATTAAAAAVGSSSFAASPDVIVPDVVVGAGDDSITTKLSKLSVQERTHGIHEVHGVADIEEETPEMIQLKLAKVSRIAESFGVNERTAAYRTALSIDRAHVEGFKLLCLRADYYDCDKAAARLVSYFSMKTNLFGPEKLTKVIVHDDLDDDSKVALDKGMCQLLQQRDRAGRAVVLAMGALSPNMSMESILRVFYYIFMAAVRDEQIQKYGVVFIYYTLGQDKFHKDRPPQFAEFLWFVPIRLAAVHFCYDNVLLGVGSKMVANSMEGHFLCRFRSHYGTDLECLFSLLTFGIPKDVWPIQLETGKMHLELHHTWLAALRNKEKLSSSSSPTPRTAGAAAAAAANLVGSSSTTQKTSTSSTTTTKQTQKFQSSTTVKKEDEKEIAVPGPMDIVMDRGRNSKRTMGYLRLRDLVEKYHDQYDNSERIEKIAIASVILRDLQRMGCRFVKGTPNGLVEQPDSSAIRKISHAFRNFRVTKTSQKGRESGTTKRGRSET